MALLSPGVQVSVIDQSNYTPAAASSVPFILLATAQNKVSGAGTGIAPGTLAANANKLYVMTSQRDLLSTFGVPFFYNTTAGTPINGYELNEYGLLAAYSALGVTNFAYVIRADIDLAALTASLTRPVGAPADGTYWLDTTNSTWGITQWNETTSAFTGKTPIVITDSSQLEDMSTVPLQTVGSIGNYAVTAATSVTVSNPTYYKRGGPTDAEAPNWQQTVDMETYTPNELYNSWVLVGSDEWKTAWPTIQGSTAPGTLTPGDQIDINGTIITVANSPNNTVTYLAGQINTALNSSGVYAANIGGKLNLYCDSQASGDNLTVTGASGTGSTATLTFAAQAVAPYKISDTILVSGVNPAGYNGTYTVTACTTTSVSFASTTTASYVSGGTVKNVPAAGFSTGVIYIANHLNYPLSQLGITAGEYYGPRYQHGPNYSAPRWRTTDTFPAPTGSVFQQTNAVNQGMLIEVKKYNSTLGTFVLQSCPAYQNDATALYALDPAGGGSNIPVGTTYARPDPYENASAGLIIYERLATGPTLVTGATADPTFTSGSSFTIQATQPGTTNLTALVTVAFSGTSSADFINAVSAANVPYVSAQVNSSNQIVFEHSAGGDIYLIDGSNTPLSVAGFSTSITGVKAYYLDGVNVGLTCSNWVSSPTFTYTASSSAPDINPGNGTYWYFSDATQADIMIQNGGQWVGYQNCLNDVRGYHLNLTYPGGPIFAATAPTTWPNNSGSLALGDLWIDTSPTGLENYPVISRWENVNGQTQWVQIDNADHTTINGILFADARWSIDGSANPITDPLPPIATGSTPLITSNWVDLDAPNPALYPQGTLLWNTRRSGFNVKSFAVNYFNATDYPPPATLPSQANTWVTASTNNVNGTPNMGRHAQRYLIVKALRAAIDTNTQLRENQAQFNLIACPSYPELAPNMVVLNNDRGDTGFNVVDTPLRLTPDEVVNWATNAGAYDTYGVSSLTSVFSEGNLASGDSYSATFYPSCTTTDLTGNTVVTAPSHMMLRTIIRSDSVAYPWFAPAGLRRGVVDNALQIGYLNPATGNFQTLGVNQGLRDVLYQNDINPITFIPGTGIVNFGNHTLQGAQTALDRINVARLVAYLRGRLEIIGNQYLFEPNDTITRSSVTNQINALMSDLVNKRGIYDYLVVCDLTNNTPATIDANELFIDIAIEPVKAVEFIYIPMRIQNTGTIAAQQSA
jgi:Phage tail sheath C-terminal domain